MHPGLRRSLSLSTLCQQLRLSLHLQVLVPLVPLSSSITVKTLACNMANPFPSDLRVMYKDLAIDLIYELVGMANLFPPDLVRFCAQIQLGRFHILLLEHDHQAGAGVQGLQDVRDVRDHRSPSGHPQQFPPTMA